MEAIKVTALQLKVLCALGERGNHAAYMRYIGTFNPVPYYYLHKGSPHRCTKQIMALVERGLARKVNYTQSGDHEVVISDAGRKFLITASEDAKVRRVASGR